MDDHLNHLRDAKETIYFGYLHGYPYNQHKIITIFQLDCESDCDAEMMVKWDVDGEKNEMVMESA